MEKQKTAEKAIEVTTVKELHEILAKEAVDGVMVSLIVEVHADE